MLSRRFQVTSTPMFEIKSFFFFEGHQTGKVSKQDDKCFLSKELLKERLKAWLAYPQVCTALHHNECITQTKLFVGNQISSGTNRVHVNRKQHIREKKRKLLLLSPFFQITLCQSSATARNGMEKTASTWPK